MSQRDKTENVERTSPRSRRQGEDRAARDAARNGPPRLRLHILDRIKTLLMINAIPMFIGIILAWNYSQGKINFNLFTDSQGHAAFAALASCFIIGISWWVIIPCAKWARNYPRWYFRRHSKILWFFPYVCGSITWGLLWVLCMLSAIVACIGIAGLFYVLVVGSDPARTTAESEGTQNTEESTTSGN